MTSPINPFIYSRAVTPAEFLGRKRELRSLFSRLATGQSTAIIGQPHIGKTSLLNYILDAETRRGSFGKRFDGDIFSYLDAQTLHGVKTQSGFWERAFAPLQLCFQMGQPEHLKSLEPIYKITRENRFGTFVLEQLFQKLNAAGSRLILLLDEFDDFLSHRVLNSTEFYGGLRSTASRSTGLVLVIAARRDLEQLNQLTQAINPHGSAYFNVFTELQLGAFSKQALSELLKCAEDRFDQQDKDYITTISGQHPYLAQAAAAMLWEAHEEGKRGIPRYSAAGRALYRETKKHFADTWRLWTNETRKAITAVALAQIPRLLTGHKFRVKQLIENLDTYSPELDFLEASGMLTQGDEDEWSLTQQAFLWWMADELRRNIRDDAEFNTWLQAQEMERLFTQGERQRMGKAAQNVLTVAGKGTTALIEAFAKGFGEAIAKG